MLSSTTTQVGTGGGELEVAITLLARLFRSSVRLRSILGGGLSSESSESSMVTVLLAASGLTARGR